MGSSTAGLAYVAWKLVEMYSLLPRSLRVALGSSCKVLLLVPPMQSKFARFARALRVECAGLDLPKACDHQLHVNTFKNSVKMFIF